ncbi:MAG: ribonuclease R [Akkermansiaceae bacterium]|nr:ribonuclease R [Akkermansiaceae bacterium]MCP5548354.1 ribonuclease R [Akkermansiaceae bacterium]
MPGENPREKILAYLRSHPSQPMTRSELARRLEIPPDGRGALRDTLEKLVSEGVLEIGKKSRYQLRAAKASSGLVGTLKFHPKGHAMFFPDPGDESNLAAGFDLAELTRVFVARRDTGTALDGDRVLASIHKPSPRRNFRGRGEMMPDPEAEVRARVEKVLDRRSGRVVGIFRQNKKFGWVDTDDKAVDGRVEIHGDTTAQPGQMVVVDLDAWHDAKLAPRGRVIEVLGWPGDPGVDIVGVIRRFGLHTSFPEHVLAEARAVPEEPEAEEIARRVDWRDKLVITIDPADAKDHDDAIWLERTNNGWRLAVHIADVSHYIKPGSPMDKEAVDRGNSTYLVDRVLPMLPVELSNGICSLKPDVDRLTKCAVMEISERGEITKARFIDAVIHSRAKLSYEQAQAILEGKPAPEGSENGLVEMVREGWNMASTLRRRRFERGALDLEMPEIKIRLDDKGRAVAAEQVVHTESHQLIEECMLAANEAVARVLREKMKPAVYRIHENPDPEKLIEYAETAALHGYTPGDLTNRAHIQKLLDSAKGDPAEHIIKLGLLKSLKRAAYAADPLGHYGLAKGDYCHFTSPIRRYADLIVHRSLQVLLDNPPKQTDRTPSATGLASISRHISDTERTSAEAESETKMIKLFEYLARVAEMHDPHEFDGIVTDARPMGLFVEVPDMGIRGVVKREDLPGSRWRFEAHRLAWVSAENTVVQPGMRVPLHVAGVDSEKRFVDFVLAGPPTSPGLKRANLPAAMRKHQGANKPAPAAKAGPPKGRGRQGKGGKPQRKLKHKRRR